MNLIIRHLEKNPHTTLLACLFPILIMGFSGCAKSTPIRTVQDYLRILSGETTITQELLYSLTTEHYRDSEHPHLALLDEEHRRQAIDLAGELMQDPAISEFLGLVTWTTTYDTIKQEEDDVEVVAWVIVLERRKGDSEKALSIPDLPGEFKEILSNGLELPFRFNLKWEENRWKVDAVELPDALDSILTLVASD